MPKHATVPPDEPAADVSRGKIMRLVPEKGFGFIRATDGQFCGQDLFFHRSSLVDGIFEQLELDSPVTFTGYTTAKGLRAESVRAL